MIFQKKLKVFLGPINYGTQAGEISRELRKKGIEALSLSYPDRYNREVDYLQPTSNFFILRPFYKLFRTLVLLRIFVKYNTFHFFFGVTLFKNQIDLPFYKFFGKKVIMEYLGWDVQLYQLSIDKYEITNASSYKNNSPEEQRLHDINKIKRLKHESKYVDKQYVCAPYLSEFVKGSEVLPLGINLSKYKFHQMLNLKDKLKILHAPTSRGNKGSVYIINAIDKLKNEGFNIDLKIVENIPHNKLMEEYISCDLFIDQIISGWYGTATIEAMAMGRPVICFIRESYFKHINYGEKIPIINANPNTIYNVLKGILEKKYDLKLIGKNSRKFVEDVHDIDIVSNTLIKEYNKIIKD